MLPVHETQPMRTTVPAVSEGAREGVGEGRSEGRSEGRPTRPYMTDGPTANLRRPTNAAKTTK